jgi:hypothetical protein
MKISSRRWSSLTPGHLPELVDARVCLLIEIGRSTLGINHLSEFQELCRMIILIQSNDHLDLN